jgi:hypothetical protein
MLKKLLLLAFLGVLLTGGCDGGDSDKSDIPSGLNLLVSECPATDIIEIPASEGYAWDCVTTGGEEFIAGTLSDLSETIDCFSTVSLSDAYCGIDVEGRARFTAEHHEFDLENPPPPSDSGCDPDFAIVIEEVECRTVLLSQ